MRARYGACTAARTPADCLAGGGAWQTVGLSREPVCQCPTGQGECVCAGPGDRLGACIAPPDDGRCAAVEGRCAPSSRTVGCLCFVPGAPDRPMLCVD